MKSKQYPYEVYVVRKRVNLSSESSQLLSERGVNQIRMRTLFNISTIQQLVFSKGGKINKENFNYIIYYIYNI